MPLMRVSKVASLLGLSPNTVRKLIDKGELKSRRIGNQRYVTEAEVRRFLDGDDSV